MSEPEQPEPRDDDGKLPAPGDARAPLPAGSRSMPPKRRYGLWEGMMRLTRFRLLVPLKRGRQSAGYKARGCAVGLFWAFTPLVGIQMALVMMTWALFKPVKRWHFSPVIACAWTWVTNVFTMVPIYYGFYVTGQVLMGKLDDLSGYGAFSRVWNETFVTGQSTADTVAAYSTWIAKEVGLAMAVGSIPYAIGFAWLGYRLALDYLKRRENRRGKSDGLPTKRPAG